MTKRNIRPQQAAPVQRETVTANSTAAVGRVGAGRWGYSGAGEDPFAGDDAE